MTLVNWTNTPVKDLNVKNCACRSSRTAARTVSGQRDPQDDLRRRRGHLHARPGRGGLRDLETVKCECLLYLRMRLSGGRAGRRAIAWHTVCALKCVAAKRDCHVHARSRRGGLRDPETLISLRFLRAIWRSAGSGWGSRRLQGQQGDHLVAAFQQGHTDLRGARLREFGPKFGFLFLRVPAAIRYPNV